MAGPSAYGTVVFLLRRVQRVSRSFDSGSNRRNRSSRLTRWLAPPPDPLPPPLRELGDRLAEAFSLDNLKDLAFTVGIEPESVPGDTLPKLSLIHI